MVRRVVCVESAPPRARPGRRLPSSAILSSYGQRLRVDRVLAVTDRIGLHARRRRCAAPQLASRASARSQVRAAGRTSGASWPKGADPAREAFDLRGAVRPPPGEPGRGAQAQGGRPRGREVLLCPSARGRVRSCVRPVGAVLMTAGPDEVPRIGSPSKLRAVGRSDLCGVVPIPSLDRVAITSAVTLPHRTAGMLMRQLGTPHRGPGAPRRCGRSGSPARRRRRHRPAGERAVGAGRRARATGPVASRRARATGRSRRPAPRSPPSRPRAPAAACAGSASARGRCPGSCQARAGSRSGRARA